MKKKAILAIQGAILVMVALKFLVAGSLFWLPGEGQAGFPMASPALAQTPAATPAPAPAKALDPAPVKDVLDTPLKKERDLFAVLQKRAGDLESRENALKLEEQRLLVLKKDIQDRMDAIKALETKLESRLDAEKTGDTKRFKELAKIYESAPPAKAGAMLEKLDTKTAASIAMSMKRDKAGAILANVSLQKAIEITKEITRQSGN